jgi:hypothetical protein
VTDVLVGDFGGELANSRMSPVHGVLARFRSLTLVVPNKRLQSRRKAAER